MEEEIKSGENIIEIAEPIIVNMGKQKRKQIKKLMKGRGKLWLEVEGVVEEASEMLGEEVNGKILLPLVLVYSKKPKNKRGIFGL